MRLISKPGFVIHRKIAWLLVFLILSLIVVGYLIYATQRSLGETSSQINRTYDVISVLQRMNLFTAESNDASYRYLQSGDASAVRQIRTSHRQLQESLDTLRRLTDKSGDLDGNIDRLAGLIC